MSYYGHIKRKKDLKLKIRRTDHQKLNLNSKILKKRGIVQWEGNLKSENTIQENSFK